MADSASNAVMPGTPLVDIPSLMAAMGIPSEKQTTEATELVTAANQKGTVAAQRKGSPMPVVGINPAQYGVIASDATQAAITLAREGAAASKTMVDAMAAAGYMDGGGNTAEMITAAKLAELKTQNQIQEIKKATNFDQLAIVLGQDLAALTMRQRELHDKIVTDSSVSLFDDPIQAVVNAFTLPWDQQALDSVIKKVDDTRKLSDDINAHVTNSAKTTAATEEKLTLDLIDKQSTAMANLAAAGVAKAKIAAINAGSQGLANVMAMAKDQLNAHSVAVQERNSAAHLKLSQAADARAAAKWEKEKEIFTREKTMQEDHLALVNAGRKVFNLPEITGDVLRRYKTAGGETAKLIETWAERGFLILNNPDARASTGETAVERLYNMDRSGMRPDPNIPAQVRIRDLQIEAYKQVSTQLKGSPKELIAQQTEKKFQELIHAELENIKPGDSVNIGQAPSYETMEKTLVGQSEMWKRFVAPVIGTDAASRKAPVDPIRIGNALTAALLDPEIRKTLSPNVAGQFLSSIFQQSVLLNNAVNQNYKFGGFEQKDYNVRIPLGFGRSVTADISNPTKATNALASMIVGEVAGRIVGDQTGMIDFNVNPSNMTDYGSALKLADDMKKGVK